MSHPAEQDLALYATRDLTFFSRLTVDRHVRNCPACAETVAEYREITAELANATPQIEDWDILAAEMRANISAWKPVPACPPPCPRHLFPGSARASLSPWPAS